MRGVWDPDAVAAGAVKPGLRLVWRWRTVADPNRPPGHRIAHPLADRAGQPCTLIAQGRNGNRLVEFDDGFRTVAPLYATRSTS